MDEGKTKGTSGSSPKPLEAEGVANGKLEADSDDDSDSADCMCSDGCIAAVSPITGTAPAFGAGVLATWGKRTKETEEGAMWMRMAGQPRRRRTRTRTRSRRRRRSSMDRTFVSRVRWARTL